MIKNVLPDSLVNEVIQNCESIAKDNNLTFEEALEYITQATCEQKGKARSNRDIQMVVDEVLRRWRQRGAERHDE